MSISSILVATSTFLSALTLSNRVLDKSFRVELNAEQSDFDRLQYHGELLQMEGTDSAMRVATVVRMGRESDRETVGRGYPDDRLVLRVAIACPLRSLP